MVLGIHGDGTHQVVAQMIALHHLHLVDIHHIDATGGTHPHLVAVIFIEAAHVFVAIWQHPAESALRHPYRGSLAKGTKPQVAPAIGNCSLHGGTRLLGINIYPCSFCRDNIQSAAIGSYP